MATLDTRGCRSDPKSQQKRKGNGEDEAQGEEGSLSISFDDPLQLGPISATAREFFAAFQYGNVFTVIARLKFFNFSDIDDDRSMDPHEAVGIEPLGNLPDSLSQ